MKVAIPVEKPSFDSPVSEHFGRARYIAIFLVTGKKLSGAELIELPENHAQGELPALLKEKGVDVLLANRVGRKALAHFQSLGIRVIAGVNGKAVDTVKEFIEKM
ncbi:NifB/NifX family molybdenum-iron cluster-binding protein [Thermococcus sp.]